jgi:hypothetical protein
VGGSGSGGGIANFSQDTTLNGDIVAGNFNGASPSTTADDLAGDENVEASSSFNLIGTGGSLGLTNTAGNQVGVSLADVGLAPVAGYGGPTQTFALLPGSFAIGKGQPAPETGMLATDQRGAPRPSTGQSDVGAFQNQGYTLTPTNTPQSANVNSAFAQPLLVTLTENFAQGQLNGATINYVVTTASGGASANLSSGSAVTGPGGQASIMATANGTAGGPYNVTASDAGTVPDIANFVLTNTASSGGVTLSGTVFFDYNCNGVLDPGEPGLAGRTVFLDLKNSGQLDPGDPSTVTAANGAYQFTGLTPGTYTVRELIQYDNVDVTGAGAIQSVTATGDVSGINFGNVLYNPAYPVSTHADLYSPHPNANGATAYVNGLYQAILDRPADPLGMAAWVSALNAGVPESQVANGFVNSLEHRQDEVNYYYETFLGRAPDPASAGWVNLLLSGGSESEVVEGILTSPEYTAEHASNADFVTDLYFYLLGRQADSAGQTAWEQVLDAGTARATVVAAFLDSPESAELAAVSYYSAFLHRVADPGGNAVWAGALISQELTFGQVAATFFYVAPDEFQGNAIRSVP